MADAPKSFEEFYSSSTGEIIDIDIVANYADLNKGDIGDFKRAMYCPECKEAELTFVHERSNTRAYLRRIPSSHHLESCSYNYKYALKKQIEIYVDSLSNEQIQDKLSSIMRMLCKNKIKSDTASKNSDSPNTLENPMTIKPQKDRDIIKSLRRKRLNGWIDKTDGEELYVFYGKVKLEVEEKQKKNFTDIYNLLKIYTMNKNEEWKYRTSIYRGKTIDDIEEDCIYNIVMIGNLKFDFKPFTIWLANWNAIKFERVIE